MKIKLTKHIYTHTIDERMKGESRVEGMMMTTTKT
jgi:hypothetical protein